MERSSTKSIMFLQSFCPRNSDIVLPAGTYDVETIEEQINGLSFSAFRRLTTTLTYFNPVLRARQVIDLDPDEVASTLARQAEAIDGQH